MSWILLALVTGASVFCVLAILAVRSWRRQPIGRCNEPVTVLKPLRGVDLGLEENLRSFFEQDYSQFELVFAVENAEDPAAKLVQQLQLDYPKVDARLVFTGAPEWHNAKVWQLARAWDQLRYDLIVMSDSDIRVDRHFLRSLDPSFDLATCPYRAIGGPSVWSSLEAVGMNTEFLAGVMTARMLEGVKFAVGPTLYCRRKVIDAVGGWIELQEFLAEDFVLGQRAAEHGFKVGLSRSVVEHRIGSEAMSANFSHRLRWYRSTRRSRPAGYVGQLFTMPLPLAMLLVFARPEWGWIFFAVLALRLWTARATLKAVNAPMTFSFLIVQDFLSFGFWLAGFFGNTIEWRGRRYILHKDGRFTRLVA